MNGWEYIGYYGSGMYSVTYEMKKDGVTGIMKIIEGNEATTTTALISLSKTYDYYVRVLDLMYINTDIRREYEVIRLSEDNDYKRDKYGMVFGQDDHKYQGCHCIYELLEYIKPKNEKEILIVYIHLLIAVYIAMSELGYTSHDFQWMYRRMPLEEDELYIVKYEDKEFSLPNIGYVPVIMDHGHSNIMGDNTDRFLYDILERYNIELERFRQGDNFTYNHEYITSLIPEEVINLYKTEEGGIWYTKTPKQMILKYINILMNDLDSQL